MCCELTATGAFITGKLAVYKGYRGTLRRTSEVLISAEKTCLLGYKFATFTLRIWTALLFTHQQN